MEQRTRKFGLIGFPLEHSFSKQYFENKFRQLGIKDASYQLYPLRNLLDIKPLVAQEGLHGFNVTIPHKKNIIQYLDHISDQVREAGAVNTVRVEGGEWYGENTDIFGFEESLSEFLPIGFEGKALILGSGGACEAAQWVLRQKKIEYLIVSRRKREDYVNYTDLENLITEYKLIINTSPVGMFPNVDAAPDIPYYLLSKEHYLFDMIYNPDKTLFLSFGEKRGAKCRNGYSMLVSQADKAWDFWTK